MTDNIINLNERMWKMKEESNQHIYIDEDGVKWFEYSYEFEHGGKSYGYGIWARTLADAEEMLINMGRGKINGQIYWSGE